MAVELRIITDVLGGTCFHWKYNKRCDCDCKGLTPSPKSQRLARQGRAHITYGDIDFSFIFENAILHPPRKNDPHPRKNDPHPEK